MFRRVPHAPIVGLLHLGFLLGSPIPAHAEASRAEAPPTGASAVGAPVGEAPFSDSTTNDSTTNDSTTDDSAAERAALEAELAAELGAQPASPPSPPFHASGPPQQGPGRAALLPDISLVGTFSANWFSDTPTERPHGHEPSHRGFQLQEIELALQSNIDPYFRADVFLAFSLFGVEVEEAYFTTLQLPWNLQVRGGQFLSPFGRINQLHYLEVTPFADLPLPIRRFLGGEQLRGLGVEGSVLLPLPFFLELRAAVQTANNEVSFGVPAADVEDLTDLLSVGRAIGSFDLADRLTLNVGLSVANGPNSSGGLEFTDKNRTDLFGADLYLRLRDPASVAYTALQAEYLFRRATVPGGRLEQGGGYAWLVRRFDKHWEAAIRADFLGLPAGTAHGHPDAQGEVAEWLAPATQQRVGASISWYPSEFSRIRLQANRDFGLDLDRGAEGVTEVFVQYQFAIGAHGAHPF